mmetsp:Transcript_63775/g.190277  ORF Transcript_63775/g.190277 Transcript_63775/m.190277 type:complete len:100 (+) Transcript_63775:120-419(+)
MLCEAVKRPLIAVAAIGAKLARRSAVALDERTKCGFLACGRVCTRPGVYFHVSDVAREHDVTVLTAAARVGHNRARIGMTMTLLARVNCTVTSEGGVLY